MKPKSFSQLEKEAPEFPDFTCPNIDAAIEKLEDLRKENAALRDCVEYWKDTCLETHDQLIEITEWKKDIKRIIRES